MNYLNKKSVEDIDIRGKRVLVRCDFNVPMKDGVITSDKRITSALPTIKYLLDNDAKVVLCSHMGKPHAVLTEGFGLTKKEKAKVAALPEEEQSAAKKKMLEKAKVEDPKKFTLKPVADRLNELLGEGTVAFASDIVGADAQAKVAALEGGKAVLLENVRFDARETKNNPEMAKELAAFADVYVNDAFGSAHRAHASTAGVADYLPAVCGYLIQKELTVMGGALAEPARPFVAILGGAKVSDKIGVIENLIDKVDTLVIGGGMAYTFMKAKGYSVGNSLCEDDKVDLAKAMMEKAAAKGVNFVLPIDTVVATEFGPDAEHKTVPSCEIPDGWEGMDIGEKTRALFADTLKNAGTVVWNGPMGVFEFETFAKGTIAVACAVAESGAISIIGGGDSAAAVEKLGFADKMTHISTGGGASLELLEGKILPGIACLNEKD